MDLSLKIFSTLSPLIDSTQTPITLLKTYYSEKFQKLQDAYSRLKAEQSGYTLTEEELYDMYEKQQNIKKAQYEKVQKETENMYGADQKTKENFEKWKRQRFSAYDQNQHDEFLKNRYEKTFYKYANTQNQDDTKSQKPVQQEPVNKFNPQSHFNQESNQQQHGNQSFRGDPRARYNQGNDNKMAFQHNSKFLAFITNRPYRSKLIDYYWEEILVQELRIFYYLSGIIFVGIGFNVCLYYYSRMRQQIHKQERLQDLIDHNHKTKSKIYIDKNFVADNNISMQTLLEWYDQPQKYNFSNHLRNRILREKKRQIDADIRDRLGMQSDED
ncbi:UNKNOWN [Stylonychia lemnae]|uniref:Transmembrane protein n=1 Tax=Stylonychia lemnae TaxID=5949 RepID=A0A077ZTE2_STYLE|nr:UNKNOWN [Stylonychia lemnae]|eukprot:CDW72600.1 UNKNOWN [Stylonychia lemnae]